MHRLRTWTRGHIAVLRAWQRHVARHVADWPRLKAVYAQLKALPLTQQTQWRRRCKATLWGVALCLVASGYAGEVQAGTTINVGASDEAGLIQAITNANSEVGAFVGADTIVLTNSTFTFTTAHSDYTALPTIASEIVIEGNDSTILRDPRAPDFRLFLINGSDNLTLLDITLSGGLAGLYPYGYRGGAIFNDSGQLRLDACTISGNTAGYGGGVFSDTDGSSTVSIVNSTVSGNWAANESGGGMYIRASGTSTVSIVNSTIHGNSAFFEGGVQIRTYDNSTMSLVNDIISGNEADDGGGMLSFSDNTSTVSLINSTVSGNWADDGVGGVFSLVFGNSRFSLVNSTISSNFGHDVGGVASGASGTSEIRVVNSTVDGNRGDSIGGMAIGTSGTSTLSVVNSRVSGNSVGDYVGGVAGGASGASEIRVVNSTVSNNGGFYAGGMANYTSGNGRVSLINSTVSNNSGNYVGGVFNVTREDSTVSLINSTVSGNSSQVFSITRYGGGVVSHTHENSTVVLHRSLIAGNTATFVGPDEVQWLNFGGNFLADDYNLFGHSGISTAEAFMGFTPGPSDLLLTSDSFPPTPLTGILSPLLADNGGPTFTHALVPGSPAIDLAGACELATDQRGFLRTEGHCDTGAYEFGARSPIPCEDTPPTFGCTVNGFINQFCVGTPGKDVILGTDGDDVIFGGAGDDKVLGKDGDDVLCGEAGNDILQGKAGQDVLDGGSGNDQLLGGFGEDALAGGSGNDRLFGGPGDDDLVGGEGTDVLKGDSGTDTCDGEKESNCEL